MKKWYTSKTLWFNALSFVAAVLALMSADPAFQHLAPYTVLALAFVNILLRVITSEKIV
jgi:hypothetical protein